MTEYFCNKGSNYYLVNTDFSEGYCFNRFGEGIRILSDTQVFYECKNYTKCNIVSVVGESGYSSEIYVNGYVGFTEKDYMTVLSILRSIPNKVSLVIFRIKHVKEGVIQALIPYKSISKEIISSYIEGIKWEKLE